MSDFKTMLANCSNQLKKYLMVFSKPVFVLLFFIAQACAQKTTQPPNIIILYADDLGIGDLSCYGASAITTPNADTLASEGLLFTDAHSAAATCTPSRYALLTGLYGFRAKAAILPGDAPLMIKDMENTLPAILAKAGYATAVVGKWHLGLGNGNINWNAPIKPGPRELGFQEVFILPSTGDRVPSVYLKGDMLVNLEKNSPLVTAYPETDHDVRNPFNSYTGISHPHLLRMRADTQHSGTIVNGVSRIGFMQGSDNAWWKDEDMADTLLAQAVSFIISNKKNPFFLYFPFHDIHVPRLPHSRFQGKSTLGARGDAILQMDAVVGAIRQAVKRAGIAENTLIIFTSDNGPVLDDGYFDDAEALNKNHKPSGIYRGGKYSIYEGGHRMPTIVWWPKTIKPGKSNAMWSQVDLLRSLAAICSIPIAPNLATDSRDLHKTILGNHEHESSELFVEAFTYAYRKGSWKYIAPTSKKHDWIWKIKNIEGGIAANPQLYNLQTDPSEKNNLALKYPDVVKACQSKLDSVIKGR